MIFINGTEGIRTLTLLSLRSDRWVTHYDKLVSPVGFLTQCPGFGLSIPSLRHHLPIALSDTPRWEAIVVAGILHTRPLNTTSGLSSVMPYSTPSSTIILALFVVQLT